MIDYLLFFVFCRDDQFYLIILVCSVVYTGLRSIVVQPLIVCGYNLRQKSCRFP